MAESEVDESFARRMAGTDGDTRRGELLVKNRSWLKRMAARALGPKLNRRYDASDVVQECLLVAERNLKTFRGRDATTFRAWLKGIQHNLIRKLTSRQLPKITREVALGSDDAGGNVAEATGTQPLIRMIKRERLDLLKRALDALDVDDRRLIERRFLQTGQDDPSYEEIARELGTNAGQLRKQMCRVLQRLDSGMTLLEQLDRQGVAPHYCRVLCWRHFRAWSVARIATELGCPEPAAKSLLSRANSQLVRTADIGR